MSRIGITVTGFEQQLLTQLMRVNQAAVASSFRISTGKRVNSPFDDPSAFFQIQRFEQRLSLLNDTKANIEVAASVAAEAQIAVGEIRSQLETIRAKLLEDEDGGLSAAERSANQADIDAAIANIRATARTSINGERYLDGSRNYTFSGRNSSQIANIDVYSLAADTTIEGSVNSAATRASVVYNGSANRIDGAATFTLTGKRGSASFSVADNELLTVVRDRINLESHNTGIIASAAGNNLTFTTVDYGSSATISITETSGDFDVSGTSAGSNASVTINGTAVSSSSVDGNTVYYRSNGINAAITFQAGFTGTFSTVTVSDDTVAKFSLAATDDQTHFAIPSLFPEMLGGISGEISDLESGGSLSGLSSNTQAAIRVVDEALARITVIEGYVDAFADVTVASSSRLIGDLAENVETSLETINTADEEEEELLLAKYEGLAANTVTAISILHQQRNYVLSLFQTIAGLNTSG